MRGSAPISSNSPTTHHHHWISCTDPARAGGPGSLMFGLSVVYLVILLIVIIASLA
jgi:hypothetical protein